jgi:hypothetical protein
VSGFIQPLSSITALNVGPTTTAAALPSAGCRVLRLQNADSSITIGFGDASITTAFAKAHTYFTLPAGTVEYLEISNPALLYVVSASGTPTLYATALG